MERIDRINKLNSVVSQLKNEFIGIDEIIDEIKQSIFSWYVTPEVNNRPVVVSLWGMTGTGKTSVVKRFLDLLDLSERTLYFDCGAESEGSEDRSITTKLSKYLLSDDVDTSTDGLSKDMIMVFDEFQHARSLDTAGAEIANQSLQPIWTLIDSGKVYLNETKDWQLSDFLNFVSDFESFISMSPLNGDIKLVNGCITDPKEVQAILEELGAFYYGRGIPSHNDEYSWLDVNEEERKKDPYRPLYVLDNRVFRILFTKYKRLKSGTLHDFKEKIDSLKNLKELCDFLKEMERAIMVPIQIDCSHSLVFILGNLDEAFRVSGDMTPDLDADVFYKETSNVTLNDIKEALKARFRPEQIARLGNTIIKYPTLKKEHFKQIISKELDRVCHEFYAKFNINISVTDSFKDLIYAEGVFPTQGARPIFTTINSIFNPLFSEILVYAEGKNNISAVVDTKSTNFKAPSVDIEIRYSDGHSYKKAEKLTLGACRCPEASKIRYINSIHEAGHAIIMAYYTGKLPLSITSVSTDRGGFCVTFDPDRLGKIDSIRDVKTDVAISMAGWVAERLVFDEEKALLGSSSDISEAWNTLSYSIYRNGLVNFIPFANNTSSPYEIPGGANDNEVREYISKLFEDIKSDVEFILEKNKVLLLQTGLVLGKQGEIKEEEFLSLIHKFGNTLNGRTLQTAKQRNSSNYYEEQIYAQLDEMARKRGQTVIKFNDDPKIFDFHYHIV